MEKENNSFKEDEKDLKEEDTIETEIPLEEEEEDPIFKSKAMLEEKENEILDLSNKLARLQADFQNFKRRTEKDREQSIIYGIEAIILDLLPVIDNFERAMKLQEDKEDNFYKGISMIEKQLVEVLEKNSVYEIEALGNDFDPNLHHAVSSVESDEKPGTVIEVLQKGYILNDKVIRPTIVVVAK
ncbi:nucleotide exchange factor GrpE [Gudongella sp. DL1XJH-153]|uniref:nucleotide exchange factor GrpE n=1 Tax=Gudongella sp. DL1XJH-153 TaxID=3409804 RepID=UPI003BB64BAA